MRVSGITPFARDLKAAFGPPYRDASLTRKLSHPGLYRRPLPRVLGGSQGAGRFLMGEVPLYSGMR